MMTKGSLIKTQALLASRRKNNHICPVLRPLYNQHAKKTKERTKLCTGTLQHTPNSLDALAGHVHLGRQGHQERPLRPEAMPGSGRRGTTQGSQERTPPKHTRGPRTDGGAAGAWTQVGCLAVPWGPDSGKWLSCEKAKEGHPFFVG